MQLKRLEAYGFKSFADKTEIDFDNGITAIVGPNGSGKSNITDAVRWVLGEQNVRNLRGTKSEDIIFAGSATRRALGVAEVSLFFDNDGTLPVDFKEVVVTRRLFRSGESEFYINKTRCRLKDINALFADTGLGQDGMSIIGQNKIDVILNSKPEERRLFFEEAAGIIKYRTRKRESIKKLEETEKNLVRVKDILSEINGRLGPLEESAQKTQEFNELQQSLNELKLTELHRKYAKLQADAETYKKESADIKAQEIAAQTAVNLIDSRKEQIQQRLLELEKDLQNIDAANNSLRDNIEGNTGKLRVLEERTRQSHDMESRLQERNTELTKEISDTNSAIEAMKNSTLEQEKQLETMSQNIDEKKAAASELSSKLREQEKLCSQLALQQSELEKKQLSKENELIVLEKELASSEESRNTHEQEQAEAEKFLEQSRNTLGEAKKSLALSKETQCKLNEELETAENSYKTASNALEQKKQKADGVHREINNIHTRMQVLDNMQKAYEGFGRGAKAVLKSDKPWHTGVIGAVAELIHVPGEYITAIETTLGGALQNIVTTDSSTAKNAIAFLKQNRLGRVTFLPLEDLIVRLNQDSSILQDKGVLGYANTLVKADSKHQKIVDFLLGKTLVMDNLDNAVKLARKTGQRMRIVTLEGDIITPGGSMSGGSRQVKEAGFLNRAEEIAGLKKKSSTLSESYKNLQSDIATELQNLTSIEHDINDLKSKIHAEEINEAQLKITCDSQQEDVSRYELQLDTLKKLMESLVLNFAEAKRKHVSVSHEVQDFKLQSKKLKEKLMKANELYEDMDQDAEDIGTLINQLELQNAVKKQELQYSRERCLMRERDLAKAKENLEKNTSEAEELARTLSDDSSQMAELKKHIDEYTKEYESAQSKRTEIYNNRMSMLVENQNNEDTYKEAHKKLSDIQARQHKLELDASQIDFKMNQYAEQMLSEYGVTPEAAAEKAMDISPGELKLSLSRILKKIEAIGPVNPNALSEYTELKERHDFMYKQSEDLYLAEDNLKKILTEMDISMTKQFKEAFKQINFFFGDIFKQLFGGGEAILRLTDSENVLESGVEIDVTLPEKKKQNLTVLSGGERSLTVVALLFAFLKYKPSPFSVLDEIDAPLDEANISRFGKFLKSYAGNTQFIVVTHRKGTMEAADAMYGVTIEDAGVSKILSVKLTDAINE